MLLALLALCIYPFIEARTLTVDEHTVQVANLPANLKNLKIVYATDIHQGRWFSQSRVNELVKTINGLSADLVILGGDYAEDSDGAIEFFENLPSISARIISSTISSVATNVLPDCRENMPILKRESSSSQRA